MQTMTVVMKVAMPGDGSESVLKEFVEDLLGMAELTDDFPIVVEYKIRKPIEDTPDPAPEPYMTTVYPPPSLIYAEEPEQIWLEEDVWKAKAKEVLKGWLENEH